MGDNISIKGPTILLSSGKYFSYERPDLSDFTIEDIAQGLSNTCRFGGQCPSFYSVAEHSVHVSRLVRPELAFEALLHDAAEAFICDMPKPLKELLPDYKIVENRVEDAVAQRFNLSLPMHPDIKTADRILLATEQQQLMENYHEWEWTKGYEPCQKTVIKSYSPKAARDFFLKEYHALNVAQITA